jgi:hypothetical protein
MCTLPLLADDIGTAFVVPTVASNVVLVVHVGTDAAGHRRVREIVALPGRSKDGVIETADVFSSRDDRLLRANGYPAAPGPVWRGRLRPPRPARGRAGTPLMAESRALLATLQAGRRRPCGYGCGLAMPFSGRVLRGRPLVAGRSRTQASLSSGVHPKR